MEPSAVKAISDTALVLLFPFFLAIGHLSPGWNQEDIKKNDKILLNYQVYLPEQKKEDSEKSVPVIIVLKDRGGKLNKEEIKLIETKSQELGKAVVIPKSPGKDWTIEDSILINKMLSELTVKRTLNLENIELISLDSGTSVATRMICSTQVKFEKVYLLSNKESIKECDGGVKQKEIYINDDLNKNILEQKTDNIYKISAKKLSDVFKNN